MTDNPKTIAIIVALDEQNAIGRNGDLLCHLPGDLKHFKKITTGHAVIMGRRTYESLPQGALPNRTNIVVTSGIPGNYPGCTVVRSVEEAISCCSNQEKAFIIGGGKLYRSTLHLATQLYLTRIHHTFDDADTFFPEIDFNEWEITGEERHLSNDNHPYDYTFLSCSRKKES